MGDMTAQNNLQNNQRLSRTSRPSFYAEGGGAELASKKDQPEPEAPKAK